MKQPLFPAARSSYGSDDQSMESGKSTYVPWRQQQNNNQQTSSYRPLNNNSSHRPSLGRIERSESKHKSREIRLHQRYTSWWVLKTPCLCLILFLAIALFGFFCFFQDSPTEKSECKFCCFGRMTTDPEEALWILWLSLGIVGILGPCFCVFACACFNRPSKRQRMKEDFYADALLEEMLTSDNVADHYDVMGVPGDQHSRGTIVFLGGLGAPRATAELHSRAARQAGYKTVAIDMPSHGTLSAVAYSLARCERVILRVMQREALLEERARLNRIRSESNHKHNRSSVGSIGSNRSGGGGGGGSGGGGGGISDCAPFLFAAYGPGAQSAVHFTSRHPNLVAGLFLYGPVVNLNDPGICGCGCCSGHGCFGCGCCVGHGFGCCANGSALIGNAPCSSIYRLRWANYLEDLLIRKRLSRSDVPLDIKERLCNGKEFQVSTAIEWNYEIRHRNLIDDLGSSGYDRSIRVVAGATSVDFVRALKLVVPHTTSIYINRIGDQFLPVWKFEECNNELLGFCEEEVFVSSSRRRNGEGNGEGGVGEMQYDALRRDKSANVW